MVWCLVCCIVIGYCMGIWVGVTVTVVGCRVKVLLVTNDCRVSAGGGIYDGQYTPLGRDSVQYHSAPVFIQYLQTVVYSACGGRYILAPTASDSENLCMSPLSYIQG